jgi:cation:H+ antiporter
LIEFVLLLLGFVCLIVGAEFLVRGGSGIARSFGISPLVVGLTIVAYGTSMPEFMASIIAIWNGISGIALGNVFESNIFNIAVVLGFIALLRPVEIEREILVVQLPLLWTIMAAVFIFGLTNNRIGRLEGILLFVGVVSYTLFSFQRSRSQTQPPDFDPSDIWAKHRSLSLLFIIMGCFLLFLGGRWVVDSSVLIATRVGLPPRVIGATLVAIGTSLPELITSIVGILRKEMQIGVGNAIGSCVFNLLMVVGGTAALREIPSDWMEFRIEIGFMILSSVILWPLARKGRLLSKFDGYVLLGVYLVFSVMILVF